MPSFRLLGLLYLIIAVGLLRFVFVRLLRVIFIVLRLFLSGVDHDTGVGTCAINFDLFRRLVSALSPFSHSDLSLSTFFCALMSSHGARCRDFGWVVPKSPSSSAPSILISGRAVLLGMLLLACIVGSVLLLFGTAAGARLLFDALSYGRDL